MATLLETYQKTKKTFKECGIDTPDLDARILVLHATGLKREDLIMHGDFSVTDEQAQNIQEFETRRLAGEPVSRILGSREFFGMDFQLSEQTLDPRPDTEILVETVLNNIPAHDKALRILDLGTGTGCIVLSLLASLPNAKAVAVDISEDAVATAQQNAKELGLSERCDIRVLDWKEQDVVKELGQFDILVSNPPYIRTLDIETLSLEVKGFDPYAALDGGTDGLDCYREIADILPDLLKEDGICAVEIGWDQAEDVKKILHDAGFTQQIVEKDLAGHDRCIFSTKK